jgi:hypothetical protein
MSWKDITDIQQSASHLDLYLDIDNIERLQTKLYDKRDDFTFPIVSFPFMSSNIRFAFVHMKLYSLTCKNTQHDVDIKYLKEHSPQTAEQSNLLMQLIQTTYPRGLYDKHHGTCNHLEN